MGESGTAMMYDPRTMTLENLGDPQITARDLADIAAQRPDLWDAIAVHPQCYPALVSWIRERQAEAQAQQAPQFAQTQQPAAQPAAEPEEQPAAAQPAGEYQQPEPQFQQPAAHAQQAPQPLTAEQWQARFQLDNGREPTLREYQEAVAQGAVAGPGAADNSVGDMKEGLKQFATGAKDFVSNRVAPAVAQQAGAMRQSFAAASAGRASKWNVIIPAVLIGAQVLAMLSVFLPFASAFGFSASMMTGDSESAWVIILCYLIAAVFSTLALVIKKKWTMATAGGVGLLFGILLFIGSMNALSKLSEFSEVASVGIGFILFVLATIVNIAFSIWAIVVVVKK
ncbi:MULTISPECIES: hypothetical protein [Actinotignum]|uniref:Leucine rich repeat variant domain-containing protein n=4 Tax=Actinomycetaceae TaxID=2049 RepID=A0AAW9HL40_9ACTO|nr:MULTISPECIES: hypothetical protein [Actinotignum]MDE1558200.1 hypothetical protein [Actinotignum schaalii]MDE1663103.1 hypothetical protein [Actinotignum schaalii]MDK6372938.1 hypothetical protein [Actinotignum timonense]MDK6419476.1 hypothetical protein [Actinotignum timonense]MDK6590014.1 hypothetical protein [Actinotignum timonense]